MSQNRLNLGMNRFGGSTFGSGSASRQSEGFGRRFVSGKKDAGGGAGLGGKGDALEMMKKKKLMMMKKQSLGMASAVSAPGGGGPGGLPGGAVPPGGGGSPVQPQTYGGFDSNGRSPGTFGDTVAIDTPKDQGRAHLIENALREFVRHKKRRTEEHDNKSTKINDGIMFEEFVKSAGLKCSNVGDVYSLVKIMQSNKSNEKAEREDSEEESEDEGPFAQRFGTLLLDE